MLASAWAIPVVNRDIILNPEQNSIGKAIFYFTFIADAEHFDKYGLY